MPNDRRATKRQESWRQKIDRTGAKLQKRRNVTTNSEVRVSEMNQVGYGASGSGSGVRNVF